MNDPYILYNIARFANAEILKNLVRASRQFHLLVAENVGVRDDLMIQYSKKMRYVHVPRINVIGPKTLYIRPEYPVSMAASAIIWVVESNRHNYEQRLNMAARIFYKAIPGTVIDALGSCCWAINTFIIPVHNKKIVWSFQLDGKYKNERVLRITCDDSTAELFVCKFNNIEKNPWFIETFNYN